MASLLLHKRQYLNNKKNGRGKEFYKNGNLFFEGEYLNDKRIIN